MSVAVVSRFPFGYYLSVLELGNKAMPHAAVAARGQFAAQSLLCPALKNGPSILNRICTKSTCIFDLSCGMDDQLMRKISVGPSLAPLDMFDGGDGAAPAICHYRHTFPQADHVETQNQLIGPTWASIESFDGKEID